MTYVNNDGASYNIEEALNVVNKMDMGGMSGSSASSKPSCKISMLWNWYTIDSCFIARSWHVNTRGQFAGSCIGVFLLVLSAQWLHRVAREYDAAISRRKTLHLQKSEPSDSSIDNVEKEASITRSEIGSNNSQALMFFPENTAFSNLLQPILYTLSHNWFWDFRKGSSFSAAYPSFVEHLIRSLIFTIQWGQSYIIMLLFMYYNGYIIISCILGALFGRIIFNYEPITCTTRSDSENNDKKCCM